MCDTNTCEDRRRQHQHNHRKPTVKQNETHKKLHILQILIIANNPDDYKQTTDDPKQSQEDTGHQTYQLQTYANSKTLDNNIN